MTPKDEMHQISRRSFIWAGLAVLGSYSAVRWLAAQSDVAGVPRNENSGLPWPLLRGEDTTDGVMASLFRSSRLEPQMDPLKVTLGSRTNGDIGQPQEIAADYKLTVLGLTDEPLTFTLDEIKSHPATEMTTEFRCIEGWSQFVQWKGVRLYDLVKSVLPAKPEDLPHYVRMVTAKGDYYVGLDLPSALHPQTLLAYEMNGNPLELENGAPIRLAIPVKYGVKNIKWIDQIEFTQTKPADYWAEQGYDWFAGL